MCFGKGLKTKIKAFLKIDKIRLMNMFYLRNNFIDFGTFCMRIIEVVKVKTSIYVDKELWERFRKYVLRRGKEVSNLLEDMIRDETIEESLESIIDYENYELDFEPIKLKKGSVSELVRVMRDEANCILR